MKIHHFFDETTSTFSYIVADTKTRHCAIIDSVLGFDYHSGRTDSKQADELVALVKSEKYSVTHHLETHIHADHLSAASYLKKSLGGEIAISQNIIEVGSAFSKVFNTVYERERNNYEFDHLLQDGEEFSIGTLKGKVIATPGHTPACLSFLIEDAVFVGDTIFMPDVGTARCDFPGGDAHTLFHSIKKILALPPETRIFICHDYPPEGRGPRCETSVSEQRKCNIHVQDQVFEDEFVSLRTERDKTLDLPALIIPSIQVNMRTGELPPEEDNGVRYLKVPIDVF